MANKKGKIKESKTLNEAFAKLFRESRKQEKKAKTFGESRKRREKAKANDLLTKQISTSMGRTKILIGAERERFLRGTLRRDHILTFINKNHCPECHKEQEEVATMELWSKGSNSEGNDVWRLTGRITGKGDYDFCKELPIRIAKNYKVCICASCLRKDAEQRSMTAPTEETSS